MGTDDDSRRFEEAFLPDDNEFDDLVAASESGLGFWDNLLDDEDWNDQ